MVRHTIPRNAHGQFAGDNVTAIQKKCEEFAKDLYSSFPDVDIFDLQVLAIKKLGWIGSMTMLSEVGQNADEKKDDRASS